MEDIYLCEFYLFSAGLHVAWLGWVVQRQHWTCFGQHVPGFDSWADRPLYVQHQCAKCNWHLPELIFGISGMGACMAGIWKICLGLVIFFASKVKHGSILHLTRGNRLVVLLFACCSPFGSNGTDSTTTNIQYYNTRRKWKCCAIASNSHTAQCVFFWQTNAICWLHLFHQLKGATRNGSWVIYWGRIQASLIRAISEW